MEDAQVEALQSVMALHKCELPSLYTTDEGEKHGERWLAALDAWEELSKDTPMDRPLKIIDEIFYLWPNELKEFLQKIASREWSFGLARELIRARIEMETKEVSDTDRVRMMVRAAEAFKQFEAEKASHAYRFLAGNATPVVVEPKVATTNSSATVADGEAADVANEPADGESRAETEEKEEEEPEKVYDLTKIQASADFAVEAFLKRQHDWELKRAKAFLEKGRAKGETKKGKR